MRRLIPSPPTAILLILGVFWCLLFFFVIRPALSQIPDSIGGITVPSVQIGGSCGGVDDTSALQSIITAAAGKYVVTIAGTASVPCVVAYPGVSLPSNSHLTIQGYLKLKASQNGNGGGLITVPVGATNVVIDGSGTIDGNNSGGTETGTIACITTPFGGSSNIWILNVTITNCRSWPINANNVTGMWIDNVKLSNSGAAPEFALGSSNAWITNSKISNITDTCFAFYGAFNAGAIANNISGGCTSDGIEVLADSGQSTPSHDIIISHNVVTGATAAGVGVRVNTVSATHLSISIVGNVLYGNNQGNQANAGGVYANHVSHISISDNIIHNDGNGAASSVGVYFSSATATYCDIIGNHIYNEGQGGTLGVGINPANCTNANVSFNSIWDDQGGSKTMAFGLNGTLTTGAQIIGNQIGTLIGAANNLTYAADTIYDQMNSAQGTPHRSQTIFDANPPSYVAFQIGIPLFVPGGTLSMGNNGVLTLTTALQQAYANAYFSIPAGGVAAGVPAAQTWYYTQCSSITVCTVFNNTYTTGKPTIPGSPTAFSTTGPGSITQVTSEITGPQFTLPANSLGANGSLEVWAKTAFTSSANIKFTRFYVSSTLCGQSAPTATTTVLLALFFTNSGVTNSQTCGNQSVGTGSSASVWYTATADTTTTLTFKLTLALANAADHTGLIWVLAKVNSSP